MLSFRVTNENNYALFAGGFLVLVGVICLFSPNLTRINSIRTVKPQSSSNALGAYKPKKVVSGHPVNLRITSLNYDLSVINGSYSEASGKWTLTTDKAQFALPSSLPNNKNGNTLIYGHYRKEVFASLHNIKPGTQAIVTTSDGYRFIYRFSHTYATTPTDTSIFSYKGAPVLTIQTCSGAWFQNRQMYEFDFVRYEPISPKPV